MTPTLLTVCVHGYINVGAHVCVCLNLGAAVPFRRAPDLTETEGDRKGKNKSYL